MRNRKLIARMFLLNRWFRIRQIVSRATSIADDVPMDRSYTEEMPLSSISSECYQTKDTLEHLPSQDSGLEVFDDVHLGRSDYDEMQSPSPDRHDNNDYSVQDMESQSIPSKCDLPKDTPQNLQGKLENRYLDTGTICSLLVENKSGLPKIPGGLKENVYFVLDNGYNVKKNKSNKSSAFPDYFGVWDRAAGTSPYSYYLIQDNGDLMTIFKRDKLEYCTKNRCKKMVQFFPLVPQPEPENAAIIQTYYTKSKLDKSYTKTACWFAPE